MVPSVHGQPQVTPCHQPGWMRAQSSFPTLIPWFWDWPHGDTNGGSLLTTGLGKEGCEGRSQDLSRNSTTLLMQEEL